MESIKIRCDHNNEIELRSINGELHVSIITLSDLFYARTAPISRKSKVDELMFYLEEFRK